VLVLLIIFMVVTPLLEKDIEIRLPEDQEDNTMPVDQQSQLVVQVSADGQIAINTEHVNNFDDYAQRLKKALDAKRRGDRLVFFLPDEKANYGVVVHALDLAKSAGADILGMVTVDLSAQSAGGTPPDATAATPPP